MINSLVNDMYSVLIPSKEGGVSDVVLKNFAERMVGHVSDTLSLREDRARESGVLYASEVGEKCMRKLYYRLTNSEAEPIPAHTHYKFLYGDIVEETALLLAEASGHEVAECQTKVVATFGNWEVRGRMDAVIDGVMVDVKSMSSFGMDKLTHSLDDYDDPFGYVDQVSFYRNFGTMQGEGDVAILGVDKTLGHIKLAVGKGVPKAVQEQNISAKIAVLDNGSVPDCGYEPVPEGKSGNMKLGVACSYCPYKKLCYPNLRTFLYSNGPKFLSTVAVEPKVPELNHGG